MADSIVLELQRDVLDRNVPVSDLLRKALVIARKLQLTEFEEWVSKELNGYKSGPRPDYRELRGEPRFWNPYHGWLAITFGPNAAKAAESLSNMKCDQPIAEVEDLTRGDGTLTMPYSYERQANIGKQIGMQTQSALFISKTSLVGILDAVRNILLNWSLKLEQDGILGAGFAFTKEEKKAAEASPQQATYYITGPTQFHQGTGTAIQINNPPLDLEAVSSFIGALKKQLPKLKLDDDVESEVAAEVASVEAQVASPKPKQAILREGLGSLRRILEGASGSAAGQLLVRLGQLLAG